MSSINSLITLETLPSTLAVGALAVYLLGRYKSNVCGTNKTCNDVLSKSNMIALVSCAGALILFLLVTFGFLSTSQSMYGGSYGGYGGYGGGFF